MTLAELQSGSPDLSNGTAAGPRDTIWEMQLVEITTVCYKPCRSTATIITVQQGGEDQNDEGSNSPVFCVIDVWSQGDYSLIHCTDNCCAS